ncbi:MAG: T9SS type A sorting domain-containing protein [Flavobacteriales bacterium]
MMKKLTLFMFLLWAFTAQAQNYVSYFTGNDLDVVTSPLGGVCLMGGATESDDAMKWFLERCDGGDVLVLRASGSDGYNDYLYSELGISVNSVETIVCNSPFAEDEEYIQEKISKAEAIWFAGGDQWNYITYWRNGPIEDLINEAISQRNIVIGGTSAGMAILGRYYFNAMNGTTTSSAALSNPFANTVTPDAESFLNVPTLSEVITDTHFDSPDRRGRLLTFIARIYTDEGVYAKGIACDEYTAVCVDENGLARVFGDYPNNDDNAYFIQVNCENSEMQPETCSSGQPLTWNRDGAALKVYRVKGTVEGTNTFDLTDWQTGNGGDWLHWSAENGVFTESVGTAIECSNVGVLENALPDLRWTVFPNPCAEDILTIQSEKTFFTLKIVDATGRNVLSEKFSPTVQYQVNVSVLAPGTYQISQESAEGITTKTLLIQ